MRHVKPDFKRSSSLDGGITVFLSLILTCICALLGGLYESARLAGGGWYLQMALNSSLDSLMSCYHREAWEQYRLFLLEYGTEEELAEEVKSYCSVYLEEAPYYGLEPEKISVSVAAGITDGNGVYLEQQILDYMKLGIWGIEQDTEVLSELIDGLREAESFQEIAGGYQERGKEILILEKSLDRLGDCLKKQSRFLRDAETALDGCNGSAFFRAAEHLEKELKKVPGLVKAYEEEAERLQEKMEESEAEAKLRKQDLKAGTWGLVLEEMEEYRSYIEEEGSRRKEVREVQTQAEANLQVVETAILKGEEVQEYIDAWEDSGDDDEDSGGDSDAEDSDEGELDEEALWQQVAEVFKAFQEDTRFRRSGIQEKEKMDVLESVSRMMGTDLLELCVPRDTMISGAVLNGEDLPSGMGASVSGAGNEKAQSILSGLFERALVTEYTARYFGCFLPESNRREDGPDTKTPGTGCFSYEQEYILQGSLSDRENLKKVVHRLLAVREAVNLLTLMGDPALRGEAEALAMAITGAAIGPLKGVVTFFVMTVWAFAESVEDVKLLLNGGSLLFFKPPEQWSVSLNGLAESGTDVWKNGGGISGGNTEQSGGSGKIPEASGLDYQDFLKLFLLIQDKVPARYRMMDLIQTCIRRKQPEFRMKRCAFRMEAELACEGPLVPVRRRAVQEY